MTRQAEMIPDLATLLDRHREEIATAWAEMVHQLPDSHYRERPLEELCASATQSLKAIIEALTTGSYAALETCLADVTSTHLRMGFDIAEVIEALLLCKDTALPVIWRAYPSDSAAAREAITQLEACLRWIVSRFSELHAAEMSQYLQEQQKRTALMLEMAQAASSSLDLDALLRHVARGITTAVGVGVDHCGFYLADEEQALLVPWPGRHNLPSPTAVQAFLSRPLDPTTNAFIRQVLERKEPVTCYDAQTDPRIDYEAIPLLGVKSILAVPFVVKGQVLAVAMACTCDDYLAFTEDQIEMVRGVANATALAIENARLREETHQRLAESQSLQRVTAALLQETGLKEILKVVCSEAQSLVGAMGSTVFLLDDSEWLQVALSTGETELSIESMPLEGSLVGIAVRRGEPVLSNDPASDERVYNGDTMPTALLAAPLTVKGVHIGALSVTNKLGGFREKDVRIISLFANQAAIAIENVRLYWQVRHLAVLEERGRLGRELHDHLAQALGTLNLKASIINELLSSGQIAQTQANLLGAWGQACRSPCCVQGGRIAQAQASLLEMKDIAREAYTDVREAIFSLRTTVSSGLGFLPTLREYLAEYRAHYGLDARLVIDNESSPRFPTDVEVQIIRIIQEALTNVRKHAGASKAWVRFEQDGDWVRISVEDDGQGFDPAQVTGEDRQYFGLQIMRERAGSMGGDLELDSRPGKGTRVVIRVPLTLGG